MTTSGEHIVADYHDMLCHSGMMVGTPIHLLTEVEMGCISSAWEIGVGVGVGITLLFMIGVIITTKNSREVKFFMFYYLKLDTVPNDDQNENLEMMEYDAFFCYRSVTYLFQ